MANKLRQDGFTLLEAVVATTVLVVGVIAIVGLIVAAKASSDQGRDTVQAANYLQECLEAVRSIRDEVWNTISVDGSYHLVPQPGTDPPWQLVAGGTESVGKFTRSLVIAPVRRADTDGTGTLSAGDQIVTSGGAFDDPDTEKITCTVTWKQGNRNISRSMNTYLTNWQK